MKVTQEISKKRISDLLCTALEGGSNYWYRIEQFIEPQKLEFMTDEPWNGGKPQLFRHLDYPLNEGGALLISDRKQGGDLLGRLDLASIQRGLELMATKFPRHWGDFLAENDDAETGDVFLQCCLFGELIYG